MPQGINNNQHNIEERFMKLTVHLRNSLDSKGLDLLSEAIAGLLDELVKLHIRDLDKEMGGEGE